MSSPVQESASNTPPESEVEDTTDQNETGVVTDPDPDSDSDKSTDPNHPTLFLKMLNFCKELVLMVFIAVAYAALTNERPPKVSKSPAAYPFFPPESPITDWFKGQITQAIEEARSADVAFVMFYAPWDAESQTVRRELEMTAKYVNNEVTFAAVNCWQPGSECKRQYSKVYKWPVLIAYPTHGRGIQYNGPLEAFHMVKFLQNVCKPLVRVEKVEELMGKYDIIVLGTLNALPGSYEYAVFHSTALRFLERDPFRETVFAIKPQGHNLVPSIQLFSWNGTVEYDGELNPDSLSTWIVKNSHQITSWAAPTGMKSLNLAGFMQPGPTLVLFTPKNPLLLEIDYYDMLRELAYEYNNCANETYINTKQKLVIEERAKNKKHYHILKERCLNQQNVKIVTHTPNVWTNTTKICNCAYTACPRNEEMEVNNDYLSSDSLQKTVIDQSCRYFLLRQKYVPPFFERRTSGKGANVTGIACSSNSSLKFVAVDSLRYYQLAEKLGIDLTNSFDKSGAVIINEKMETHHVMTATVNLETLRSFVYNFTQKVLPRSLRSKVNIKTKYSHFYPHLSCSNKLNNFCVLEMNSSNFLASVLQPNKVVIVFYYSKQCSFCNGISYVFLTVARMLATLDDIIFARIDGELNLLPWEYTMDSYPTILFFPTCHKSESRAFPKNIPITVPNLLGFILTNVNATLKLKTMYAVCSQSNFPDCVTSVRMETLTVIGKTLREWRSSTRKQKVLYKLQTLKSLHLLFAHSPHETSKITNYLNKLRD